METLAGLTPSEWEAIDKLAEELFGGSKNNVDAQEGAIPTSTIKKVVGSYIDSLLVVEF